MWQDFLVKRTSDPDLPDSRKGYLCTYSSIVRADISWCFLYSYVWMSAKIGTSCKTTLYVFDIQLKCSKQRHELPSTSLWEYISDVYEWHTHHAVKYTRSQCSTLVLKDSLSFSTFQYISRLSKKQNRLTVAKFKKCKVFNKSWILCTFMHSIIN